MRILKIKKIHGNRKGQGFLTTSCLVILLVNFILEGSSIYAGDVPPSSERLLLTPLIKSGKIKEALELSRVRNFTDVLSYSGFLTVDEECGSNLFFWFFPAAYNRKEAPVILWHGGGPGSSALLGLFVQNGPFSIDDHKFIRFRENSWTFTRSVLYLDSPVGSGFSEADRKDCYSQGAVEAAKDVYEALDQFYKLFPEHISNDFYVFSGSYGGKIAPAIAYEIHVNNIGMSLNKSYLPQGKIIHLRGFGVHSGFTDPIHQIDYGEFYYGLGLIDQKQKDYFKWKQLEAKQHILKKNWADAFDIVEPLIIGTKFPSLLKNYTGLQFPYNFVYNYDSEPSFMHNHEELLNRYEVRQSIHAGMGKHFANANSDVYQTFKKDIYKSVKSLVENLLDSGMYRILITSAQMDLIVPHTTISKFVNALQWRSGVQFRNATMQIWRSETTGEIGGYQKTVDGLTYLYFRNVGHILGHDRPDLNYEIMTKFTDGMM